MKGIKDPFDFLDRGLDKLDGAFDKMDESFDKMDDAFDKITDMFDGMDFGNIDDLHTKIQNVKNKFNISTAEALSGYKKSYEKYEKERDSRRDRYQETKLDDGVKIYKAARKRQFAAIRNIMIIGTLFLVGLAFGLAFWAKEDTSSAPPLVEHSAPLNPTLDSSTQETEIPKLKVVE